MKVFLVVHATTAKSIPCGHKYRVQPHQCLMMEMETASRILDVLSKFKWLIFQEDMIAELYTRRTQQILECSAETSVTSFPNTSQVKGYNQLFYLPM
jgi:hypothetical protein